MGLERISAIMQHKSTNYDGDILQSLIGVGERLTHTTYGTSDATDTSLRIMADHSRAVTFMIADGILPSNEGRGYVLRRLLRRAIYHGRILGVHEAFLATYAHEVERLLGGVYPEITANKALIDGIIAAEEERFSTTLETGRTYLDDAMATLEAGAVLPGDIAFALHDTYGFPVDLTREICERAGHAVDMDGFGRLMEQQRSRARAQVTDEVWGTFSDVWVSLSDTIAPTTYIGYDYDRIGGCEVLALVKDGASVQQAVKGDDVEVVLSRTPFYAEMGGEVGDSGELEGIGFAVAVHDTQTRAGGLVSHVGHVTGGTLSVGDIASGSVDVARRALIRRNHTATHLLDAALKRVLGDHVNQAGSHVDEHGLRFDFTHFEAVTADELASVERIVNEQIIDAKPVVTREMPIDEAKASGAVALFGEKYGDVVRVVSVGAEELPFSRELCGGMHATNTAQLGLFKIVSESSVGSNARRIEAVTSRAPLTSSSIVSPPSMRPPRSSSAAPTRYLRASRRCRASSRKGSTVFATPSRALAPTRSPMPWPLPSMSTAIAVSSRALTAWRPSSFVTSGTPSATAMAERPAPACWPRRRLTVRWPFSPRARTTRWHMASALVTSCVSLPRRSAGMVADGPTWRRLVARTPRASTTYSPQPALRSPLVGSPSCEGARARHRAEEDRHRCE